jgi:hypothetical protein
MLPTQNAIWEGGYDLTAGTLSPVLGDSDNRTIKSRRRAVVFVSSPLLWQNQLLRRKNFFCSWFQKFQPGSLVSIVSEPIVKQSFLARNGQTRAAHLIVTRKQKEKERGKGGDKIQPSWRATGDLLPPIKPHLLQCSPCSVALYKFMNWLTHSWGQALMTHHLPKVPTLNTAALGTKPSAHEILDVISNPNRNHSSPKKRDAE